MAFRMDYAGCMVQPGSSVLQAVGLIRQGRYCAALVSPIKHRRHKANAPLIYIDVDKAKQQ
jgi:hypothetical protein